MELYLFTLFALASTLVFGMAFSRIVAETRDAVWRYRRTRSLENRIIRSTVVKAELSLAALLFIVQITVQLKDDLIEQTWVTKLIGLSFMYVIYRIANIDTRIMQLRVEARQESYRHTANTPIQEEGL